MKNKNYKTNEKTGVIILGHGSRRRQANTVMRDVIKRIGQNNGFRIIEPAYLQLSRPDLGTAVKKIAGQGCQKIIIVPFFLFSGNHVRRDIPQAIQREKKRHKGVEFIYTRNLGRDPRIAAIVEDCIKDARSDARMPDKKIKRILDRSLINIKKVYPLGLDPKKIEQKSFEIINRLVPKLKFGLWEQAVAKRVIHATTDLEYAKDLSFHPQAIKAGIKAIRAGKDIICDVGMVQAGINKKLLGAFGGKAVCFINDKDVAKTASKMQIARAIVAMRKAEPVMNGAIVAIGNAPTALFELCDLVKKGKAKPALIIGIPVGFVGAREAKQELRKIDLPYITNAGTKGGSSVAAAITNALLKLAGKEGRR